MILHPKVDASEPSRCDLKVNSLPNLEVGPAAFGGTFLSIPRSFLLKDNACICLFHTNFVSQKILSSIILILAAVFGSIC